MNNIRFLRFPVSQLVLALVLVFAVLAVFAMMDLSTAPRLSPILTRGIGAALAAGVVLLLGKKLQGKTLDEIGIAWRGALPQVLQGALAGVIIMAFVAALMWLAGWYTVSGIEFNAVAIGRGLVLFLFASLFEELLFRGILFWQLENVFGSWLALALSSALFGATHFANQGATLWSSLTLAINAGLCLGAAYLVTRTIWMAVGLHWAWNFLLGPILGFAVSGNNTYSLLAAKINGPELWTGGAFGPEAGLPVLIAGVFASVGMLWVAARRKHILPPSWSRRQEIAEQPTQL